MKQVSSLSMNRGSVYVRAGTALAVSFFVSLAMSGGIWHGWLAAASEAYGWPLIVRDAALFGVLAAILTTPIFVPLAEGARRYSRIATCVTFVFGLAFLGGPALICLFGGEVPSAHWIHQAIQTASGLPSAAIALWLYAPRKSPTGAIANLTRR